MTTPGLRDRKKQEVRDRISAVATAMFLERGFDAVSVAEVAEAAGVSRMTVFNHFRRKEELMFDRGPEAVALISAAIRGRPGDPVAGLRDHVLRLYDERHPLAGFHDRMTHFWRVVLDSPALKAAMRESIEQMERLIATQLAEVGHPRPGMTAALIVAGFRTAYAEAARRMLAGESADSFFPEQRARVARVFDAAQRAAAAIDP